MGLISGILFSLCLLCCNAQDKNAMSKYDDLTSWEDKQKLDLISKEFIYQIQLLQRQLLPLKLAHVSNLKYQVGLVIGTMREKYKRMMEIYIEVRRRDSGRIKITARGLVTVYKPIQHMLSMETVRMLEVEIHKYVDLLARIPEDDLFPVMPSAEGPEMVEPPPEPPQPAPGLRSGTGHNPANMNSTPTTSPKILQQKTEKAQGQTLLTEDEIKMMYRSNYMKQHGLGGDEWSLDHHYGFQ